MRILFILKGLGLVRHFDEVVEHLVSAGHEVVLAQAKPTNKVEGLPERLARLDRCQVIRAAAGRDDGLKATLGVLRLIRDYLRYHEPPLWKATANRHRALTRLLGSISDDTLTLPADTPDLLLRLTDPAVTRLRHTFSQLESLVPADEHYMRFLKDQRPDLLLVTPLVNFGGRQAEYVKAARALKIPSAGLVFSWDNLSNKGLMHAIPDRVFGWNELQRREAVELHGAHKDAVVPIGAPRFDAFYRMSPSSDRETLCRNHGLDPSRRLAVYLASSPHVAPNEPTFTARWLDAVRSSGDPMVRELQVLVRPHPRERGVWSQLDTPPGSGIALARARSVQADQSLYDVLKHADVAIGLNTSAELEAGILGTPVYTIDGGADAPGQAGSTHYRYLLADHGGFVEHAATLEEHVGQLSRGLGPDQAAPHPSAFVEQFVRPRGADRPVSPQLADALVSFAASGDRMGWMERAAQQVGRKLGRVRRRLAAPSENAPKEAAAGPRRERVVYEGAKLHILVSTDAEQKWRRDPGKKEPWTVAWLNREVNSGDVLYDIGANVGVFSLIGAANLGDAGTVVAFEPGYNTFARLCENIQLNRFAGRIVPVPLPLSDKAGLQPFRYNSMEPGQSQHRFATENWTPGSATALTQGRWQPMLAAPLDLVVSTFGLPRRTLMKIVVDGVEDRLLTGAAEVLRDPGLRSVLIEVDQECEAGVLTALEAAGLALVERFTRKKEARVWYGVFGRS